MYNNDYASFRLNSKFDDKNSIWRGEHIIVICHIHEEVFDLPGFCLSCIDSIIQSNLNYYNYDTNYTES